MNGFMTTSLAALALVAAPAFAQDATTGGTTADTSATQDQAAQGTDQMADAGGGQSARDSAIQSAQGVGIGDAQEVAGAFVLQGTSPTGAPIMMIVGPAGELLALATPFMLAPPGEAAGGVTDVAPTSAETGAQSGDQPAAGEAADEGFMATQTQPATPGMWDPAQVEGAMGAMGGGGTTTTTGGETTTAPAP